MIKLHLCCGKRDFGPDWVHIDQADFPHIFSHSVTELPFLDESVDLIYCCHGIAYWDRHDIVDVFTEWRRVLRPGGILRLATPDARKMAEMLTEKIVKLEEILGPLYGKMLIQEQVSIEFDNRVEVVRKEKVIYHKTTYELASIGNVLNSVGFKDVFKYDHKFTDHAQFDDHSAAYLKGRLISLNVECTK